LKAELPWRLLALAWLPEAEALRVREALRPLMGAFAYAACVPFGREPSSQVGLLFRAAAYEAAPDAVLEQIERSLGLTGRDTLRCGTNCGSCVPELRKRVRASMLTA